MTENNKNEIKPQNIEGKKTLTLGLKGKAVLERKIKESTDQKTLLGKRKSVLEVVSNNKTSLKTNLAQLSTLGYKTKIAKETSDSGVDLSKNIANHEILTDDEKKNRLAALEKARGDKTKNDASEVAENNKETFIGFSIIKPVISSVENTEKKDKKHSSFKEGHKKDNVDIEESVVKKKTLSKKRERNESERAWKDAYYEEDIKNELEDVTVLDDEEEVIEEISFKDVEAPVVHHFYNNSTIKRVGKTKKDRYKSKEKIQKEITITGKESIKTLSYYLGEKIKDVLEVAVNMGIEVEDIEETVLDIDTAELIILELGHLVKKYNPEEEIISTYKFKDKTEDLKNRPPVITIMGHVDHGKTTLLDYIRKTNVVSKESGGITQHIGAYQIVTKDNKKITFLDTPGHEAFAEMRARGTSVTDIIVLVVAADDGLKQQSMEVINLANSSNVPIIVAINKIDKPNINTTKVKTDLLQNNVVIEEMGGKILCAEISALKGEGVDLLLENILLEAELLDLKANKNRNAIGTVIESRIENGKGIVATIIVQNGTLKQGDIFVVGNNIGKARVLYDDKGKIVKMAEPSMPVEIVGFSNEVKAGDELLVVKSESDAKKMIDYYKNNEVKSDHKVDNVKLLLSTTDDISYLSVILKTDVYGSKEAIIDAFKRLGNNEVKIKLVHSGVGAINESDVILAKTTGAIICGFNVRSNNQAKILANSEKINIYYYNIIYDLLDNLKELLSGMLTPRVIENILGYATIKEVFNVSKVGKIAGCIVTEGIIRKSAGIRLLRNNVVIYEGILLQLKRFKDDSKEVSIGQECGVMLHNFQDISKDDVIECFEKISEKQEL